LLLPRDVVECARQLTDGLGVDTGFDTIDSEKTALQVIDAVAPGGRAVGRDPSFRH
jgi:threonine dehydrogenase-like Zn-dependent dehydrogenase